MRFCFRTPVAERSSTAKKGDKSEEKERQPRRSLTNHFNVEKSAPFPNLIPPLAVPSIIVPILDVSVINCLLSVLWG